MTNADAVQPRVCGEQALSAARASSMAGSAPRVRGAEDQEGQGGVSDRFSPACAGSRPTPSMASIARPVQPRVCGEQVCGNGS